MPTDPISALHAAIVARLREKLPAKSWMIEPVPWAMTTDDFKRLMKVTPWIGIAWSGLVADKAAGRAVAGPLGVTVYVCTKNSRLSGRYLGDATGPGLYPSTVLVAALLAGLTVPPVGTLRCTGLASAYAEGVGDMDAGLASITFEVHVDLGDFLADHAALDDFATLVTSWDFTPDGTTEGEPTDTTTLPEAP